MNAYQYFKHLSMVPGWAAQTRKVRWLAARYYAGVDTLDQLLEMAEPQFVGRGHWRQPILTETQVDCIIQSVKE